MSGLAPLEVLVTVEQPPEFLEAVQRVVPGTVVHHLPVDPESLAAREDPLSVVPADLLAAAEVIYTSSVLPGAEVAPRLRWVQLDTSGIDHVRHTPLWDRREVAITTLGGVSPAPLAEWVMMMVLAHAHHLRATETLGRSGTWPTREERWQGLMPRNLRESTLAVVGFGRIGQEVARLARAFGMRVTAVRRGTPEPSTLRFGAEQPVDGVVEAPLAALTSVLAEADYVVLTVPLTPQTQNLFDARLLATLKPGAVLVNGSRGGVVEEAALVPLLDDGSIDLYASDVFETEPLPAGHPFWGHPRVVVTPHVAGFAPDYLQAVTRLVTDNLRRYAAGEPLLNQADRERGY